MHSPYSSVCSGGLAHRSYMSFSWCIHPKHVEEKWNPLWFKLKFILNQSSKLLGIAGAHMRTNSLRLFHTLEKTRAFPRCMPVSLFCPPPPLWIGGLYGPVGRGLFAPKCCFSPHYCQGIHRWLMMDYISAGVQGFPSACDLQQRRALFALAATLTMESTAQGISHKTF